MSPFPIPCINRTSTTDTVARYGYEGEELSRGESDLMQETPSTQKAQIAQSERGEDDWVKDINTLLQFNASFNGRGLLGGKGAYEENDDR